MLAPFLLCYKGAMTTLEKLRCLHSILSKAQHHQFADKIGFWHGTSTALLLILDDMINELEKQNGVSNA